MAASLVIVVVVNVAIGPLKDLTFEHGGRRKWRPPMHADNEGAV